MPNKQTFAEYLINKLLPGNVKVEKPVDSSYLKQLLIEVSEKHPTDYDRVVMDLKNLGDKLSTWEAMSIGLDEISVPNKANRDQIVKKYEGLASKSKNKEELIGHLENLQKDLADNDLANGKDDATSMIQSAMGGKRYQLMKLRTSPGVVSDHRGDIVNEIFPRSYAEGVDPLHFWLGAAESRKNLAEGQVSTSAPGELSKVLSNVLNSSVVSKNDCRTQRGIELFTKDENVVGRYLAKSVGGYQRNKLVDENVQQELLRKGVEKLLVRSPQTCQATDNTVCSLCMGTRPGTGKNYQIGDNVGMITAGSLGEPLTQMSLSSKHSTSLAKKEEGLVGEKGFRKFVEMPTSFSKKKILCEVYGEIYRIRRAPQGGFIITIRETRKVPERYIQDAKPNERMKRHWDYFVPPQLKILEEIKEGAEVYPGLELTDGHDNIKDTARLRNLGAARSASAEGMYNIYKNTGNKMHRAHFELLARNAHPYVKIEKAPSAFPFKRGEVVDYNKLENELAKFPSRPIPVTNAMGMTLTEGVLDFTAGTEVTEQVVARLKKAGVRTVKATNAVEVSPATTPLSRVVNQQDDWVAALNHRFLKSQMKDAASTGKRSNIHGYNPMSAYAYGVEMRQDEQGRY